MDPSHPARPMEVVFDEDGSHWLCDKGVHSQGDLAAPGCRQCDDFQPNWAVPVACAGMAGGLIGAKLALRAKSRNP